MPISYAILFGAGLLAGLLNVLAGGGSLITLPALLFLGLPAPLANGTNRIAILVQNVAAVESFRRSDRADLSRSFKLSLVTIPGAIIGAGISLEISDLWFRRILAAIIVGAVISLLTPSRAGQGRAGSQDIPTTPLIAYIALFGIGFYGGFIQAGVGMLFLLVLHRFVVADLVWVNVHKVFIVAVYTVPALAVFIWTGNVNWRLGAVLAAGNVLGALLATKMSVRGGERVVKVALAVALLGMAVRLAW